MDYANQKIDNRFGGNVFFLLADHIDFAIQRMQKHINLQLSLFYEVKHLYPQEAELARVALEIIQKDLGVKLPKEEQAAITLHFVNFQLQPKQNAAVDDEQLIEDITLMLQQELKISINRDGFNYYRFVSHLHYLMERTQKDALIATQNSDLFESFRDQFPDIYYCAAKIAVLLHRKTGKNLNDEEILYLMLHINRLYAREDCEQADSSDQTHGHT